MIKALSTCLFIVVALASNAALSAGFSVPGLDVDITTGEQSGDGQIATALQVLALLTVLSLAPALLIVVTSFTRIIIVLSMLRQAFGMQQTPPNTVLVSLALFLTLFTMMPVLNQIDENALQPVLKGELAAEEGAKRALEPLREFMIRQTREKDLERVIEMSGQPQPESFDDISNISLISAFMLSELQSAFQIGFVIFLPFLLIDLVAASVLMAMGMIMVPPMTISLPVKILMFALIEGWSLVAQALVGSFK